MPALATQTTPATTAASRAAHSHDTQAVIPLPNSSEARRGAVAWRAVAYLLTFASGAAAMFCFSSRPNQVAPQLAEAPPFRISQSLPPSIAPNPLPISPASSVTPETSEPEPVALTFPLHLSGTLEPAPGRHARLPLATSQAVAFVDVQPGDRVKKGWQVFSHWESPDRLQAARTELAKTNKLVEVARSRALAAEQTAARLKRLEGKVSAQELQDAESAALIRRQEVEAAELAAEESESRFAALEFEFNQAFVTTPIEGLVASVDVVVGERRQVGGAFRGVTVVDPRQLQCRCWLTPDQLGLVLKSAPAQGTVEKLQAQVEFQGRTWPASVSLPGVVADPETGLVPLVLTVPNDDETLRAGLRVDVQLTPSPRGRAP